MEVQGDNNLVGSGIQGEGNLISGNTSHGVEISEQFGDTTLGNLVQGNLIGTTRNGNGALGNGNDGVSVTALSAGNRIGGTNSGAGNVIAANGAAGVHLFGPGTLVEGNLIGTDDTGVVVLANGGDGVEVSRDGNWVGGPFAGAGNVIAGNGGDGASIAANDNRVMGNAIGTDVAGTVALGNAGSGVAITGDGNRVGSVDVTEPQNTIAFNVADGVAVTGANTTDNAIRRNAIFSNGDLGIDLDVSGVLLNDVGDVDAGANDLQNYPVITSAITTVGSDTSVTWNLDGQTSTDYRIEFFANDTCDPLHPEGKTFLGATTVSTTAASGIAEDKTVLTTVATVGQFIVATATVERPGPLTGPTSEFSTCILVT